MFEWFFGVICPLVRKPLWEIARAKSAVWEGGLKKKEFPGILKAGSGMAFVYAVIFFILFHFSAEGAAWAGFSSVAELLSACGLVGGIHGNRLVHVLADRVGEE
ncbi:hypothetical protein [Nocardiopsis halophila]|uniref:hypothetical protein n=1 Tax=Nocardiopsis halophila TaxID=141692 RepID=UPI0012688C04|nr:hypothetical protein [Nocardiopsis halophila]